MTLPFSFSNNSSPTGGQLDADLLALGAMGITSTTATGLNAVVLVPNANQPTVSVYVNNALFSFAGTVNSTGNVTIQVGSLSPLPLYLPSGLQAGAGVVTSGTFYIIVYLAALNSGAGGFQIISAIPSANLIPVTMAAVTGLLVKNDGSTPSTKIDITAQTALVTNASGSPVLINAPNVVIDLTTVGANGMDVGSRPTSGWVYTYLISTGSTTSGLATATSPTAGLPTLPGGYSYLYYCGAMYCDGSQNLLRSRQQGRMSQYVATTSSNTVTVPIMDNGTAGTYNFQSPTLKAVTVVGNGAFVPLTAGSIAVWPTSSYHGSGPSGVLVAPNNAYSGTNIGPSGSASIMWPFWNNANFGFSAIWLVLESAAIYWASAGAGGAIGCAGWEDYYVRT